MVTDITDFYNQIYLHRLNNAIEFSDIRLKSISSDIEDFLSKLNNKSSQGIPVGPAASIILAEAIMIDIDQFLIDQGVNHTRYVDDFRIFSDSKEKLYSVLDNLTVYLYENYRLTLSSDKTKIIESEKYINEILHNHYELEKNEMFETLEILNPYSNEIEYIEVPIEDEQDLAEEQIAILAQKVLERKILDLGLSRALIRKAKKYRVSSLVDIIFENFDLFLPVVNDVCLYLASVSDDDFVREYKNKLVEISHSVSMDRKLVRLWFEWYISSSKKLLEVNELKEFIFAGSNIVSQSRAAIVLRNISWVRSKKNEIFNVGEWERRAILHAAQILPLDEKNHWLKLTESSSPILLDRYVAKWVREAL